MTTHAIAAMLVASLAGGVDVAPLVQEMQGNNIQSVIVCPRPIITEGQDRTSVANIALLATEQIEQMTQQLINESRGQYRVIDPDVAFSAIQGLTIDDLSNPEVRRGIGQKTGAQAMIFVFAEENAQNGQWDMFWKLVQLGDSSIAHQSSQTMDIILSDAAYMGESFEVRRWGRNGIEPVGFDARMPRDWAMGVGPEWERLQYASLLPNTPHPLENPQMPYGVQLVVNGQPMRPERICDKLYVPIDPAAGPPGQGPDIGIRMFNHSGDKVFMAVYIDGVNMINQERQLPIMTPTHGHWSVRNGYDSVLRHWYHLGQGALEQRTQFQLVDARDSVAARTVPPPGAENFVAFGDRIDDRLGMITCIVYTFGWDGVDANPNPPPQRGGTPRFAFGEGYREDTRVRWEAGERGIMLAAMTLHYRTPQELDQIRAMGCEQMVSGDQVPNQGGSISPQQTGPNRAGYNGPQDAPQNGSSTPLGQSGTIPQQQPQQQQLGSPQPNIRPGTPTQPGPSAQPGVPGDQPQNPDAIQTNQPGVGGQPGQSVPPQGSAPGSGSTPPPVVKPSQPEIPGEDAPFPKQG